MATSSGTFHIQVLVLAVMCGVLAAVVAQTAEDERRPYKFGFTIENMQHRQEEKDERGIIMGEYGFITADGWYLTTIYATDEEGRFKILGRKRERVGPPLDNFTPQVTLMDDFSPQSSTARPPTFSPTSNPITISSPRPFQTAAPTTFRPTTFRPSTASSPFVQTTAAFQPSRQQGGIPGCGGCIIPTTTSRPSISPDFVSSTAGFRPSGAPGNFAGSTSRPGSFNSDRNPSGPGNFNSGSTNRPGSFSSDRNPSGPGGFNSDRNPSGPSGFNSGSTSRPGSFNSDRNPSGPGSLSSSTNRPGSFNSDRNPSGPGNFNSGSTSRPGNFNSDRFPSGPGDFNSGSTNRPGGFNSDRNPSGPGNNDDDFNSGNGGNYNRPSSRPTSSRPSGPFGSATASTPSTAIPFTRPTTRYPGSGLSSTTNRPITNGGYNQPGFNNRPNNNRPSGPSGFGDSQQGESGLNYRFNYTTDFQGHHETGYKDGSKVGGYFYNGPDGVGQRVTYEANEFGYQPQIINVQLSSNETPRQDEDRNAQLKGSEFLWFKR